MNGRIRREGEGLFPALNAEPRCALDSFTALIDTVFPLARRFRAGLAGDVAELSRLLTAGRGERREGYLGQGAFLSAYLRYFLPWNVYRLARLFPALPLALKSGDALTDLGSGPLTTVIALWLSRPDLRNTELEFRCADRTAPVLEAGKKIFGALAGAGSPWRIKTVRSHLGAPVRGPRAALVSAVNVFNETFERIPPANTGALRQAAERDARLLASLAADTGAILVVEPGVPRSGEFIAALRAALAAAGRLPVSPCPHAGICPLPGGRGRGGKEKWCHFAFDTNDAPTDLLRLSAAAGIPKDRAVLSFLLAGPAGNGNAGEAGKDADSLPVRIISDAFPLPASGGRGTTNRRGRYGCSARGLILAVGDRAAVEEWPPGTLLAVKVPDRERRDPKSGALMVE